MRATSTTTSLVSIKFLTFLFMGAGSWDDLPLYIVAITCSVTGLQARRPAWVLHAALWCARVRARSLGSSYSNATVRV